MLQDDFYLKRNQMLFLIDGELPKEKIMMENFDQVKLILSQLEENISLKNIKVLEVGCFIGDFWHI